MNNMVLKKLKHIKSPILIIHSQNDEVSIRDNVDIIQSEISSRDQEVIEVQYAHHNIFDTNKDTPIINKKIIKFIRTYK
jgi:esterase/lipase